jgi:hypothetical protein
VGKVKEKGWAQDYLFLIVNILRTVGRRNAIHTSSIFQSSLPG